MASSSRSIPPGSNHPASRAAACRRSDDVARRWRGLAGRFDHLTRPTSATNTRSPAGVSACAACARVRERCMPLRPARFAWVQQVDVIHPRKLRTCRKLPCSNARKPEAGLRSGHRSAPILPAPAPGCARKDYLAHLAYGIGRLPADPLRKPISPRRPRSRGRPARHPEDRTEGYDAWQPGPGGRRRC